MNREFLAPISFVYTVRRGGARELSNPREGFPVRWSPIRVSRCVEFQFGSSRLATSHRQFLHLSRCAFLLLTTLSVNSRSEIFAIVHPR